MSSAPAEGAEALAGASARCAEAAAAAGGIALGPEQESAERDGRHDAETPIPSIGGVRPRMAFSSFAIWGLRGSGSTCSVCVTDTRFGSVGRLAASIMSFRRCAEAGL